MMNTVRSYHGAWCLLPAGAVLLAAAVALCAEAKPAPKGKPEVTAEPKRKPAPKVTPKSKTKTAPKPKPKPKAKPKPAIKLAPRPPSISFVYPTGARKGTTITAMVSGLSLKGATGVRFTGRGVTAKILPPKKLDPKLAAAIKKKKSIKTSEDRDEEAIHISMTISPDAEPGLREMRIVSPGGVSNRHRVLVGQIPEVVEKEPNSAKSQAQPLPSLPVVANGQIFSSDVDIYRFNAKAGQTIVCQAKAQCLQPFIADAVPSWFQAVLVLYDANGRELMYADDFRFKPDPVLIYTIPTDGQYLIEIRDAIYRGRGDFVYRLTIGALPYITHLYPLAGRRKSTAQITLSGANLPKQTLSITLADNCPALRQVKLPGGGTVSNALPFGADALKEVGETEPNNALDKANRIQPPVAINGRIHKPGDVDFFVITAKANERLVVEVRARRLDSPLDSIVTVLTSRGGRLVENDDTDDAADQLITHHADSYIAYTFRTAGDYAIRLRDVQGKGGPEYAYRLTVAPPRPDFTLRVLPDNPCIAPGQTALLTAEAVRTDGFAGEIRLALKNLPEGFVVRGMTIPAGQTEARFTVTAPPDVPLGLLWPSPALEGTAKIGTRTVLRKATPAEEILQAFITVHRVPTSEFLMSVVEPVPFALSTDLPAGKVVEIPQGGEAKVVVKLTREKGTTGAIRLKADKPPKGVYARVPALAAGKNETTVSIRVQKQLGPGFAQNVIIVGTMKVGKQTIAGVAPAIPIRVVAPPKPKPTPKGKTKTKK